MSEPPPSSYIACKPFTPTSIISHAGLYGPGSAYIYDSSPQCFFRCSSRRQIFLPDTFPSRVGHGWRKHGGEGRQDSNVPNRLNVVGRTCLCSLYYQRLRLLRTKCSVFFFAVLSWTRFFLKILLRGTIVNRTYGKHKYLYG